MEYMDLNNGRVQVSAMGIADFLDGCFTKFKEGYQLDITQNDTYPVAYGGYFAVVLVPPAEVSTVDLSIQAKVENPEEKEDQELVSEENPAEAEEKVAQATKSEDISQEKGKPGRKGKLV